MICHTFLLVLSVLEGCCRVAENYFSILKIFLFPISPHQRFKLSYLSKRKASTTQACGIYPVSVWCCHTSPNERLLQQLLGLWCSYKRTLSYLSKRKASTTYFRRGKRKYSCVVIPLQTKGFYNLQKLIVTTQQLSCHTSPNERLLQRKNWALSSTKCSVVIPLQTKGFYNSRCWEVKLVCLSCHTSPNERLLQLIAC